MFLVAGFCINLSAQRQNAEYVKYINQYKSIAIENQHKYKIPASITLAQGLLESGAGKGRLAREGNNHFGIKCHTGWKGRKIYHDDDLRGECFRRYGHARESYEDHSKFLTGRDRYQKLFNLNPRDYKGWAKGLQSCGYATDRSYATKLIRLIEDYELHQYDKQKFVRPVLDKRGSFPAWYQPHEVFKSKHGLLYIVARENDTYELIGKELDFSTRSLRRYNEVPKGFPLMEGDIVYLEKKKKKVGRKMARFHKVSPDESMHEISQIHGIRIKNLYKMNDKTPDYVPQEGDELRLR